jgi:hypothetical protein
VLSFSSLPSYRPAQTVAGPVMTGAEIRQAIVEGLPVDLQMVERRTIRL